MVNRVEKIMNEYRNGLRNIDEKYKVEPIKEKDTKGLDAKIKKEQEFIKEIENKVITEAKGRLNKFMHEEEEADKIIQYQQGFINTLKFEGATINEELIQKAEKKIQEAIDKKNEINKIIEQEKAFVNMLESNYNKINNSEITEAKRRLKKLIEEKMNVDQQFENYLLQRKKAIKQKEMLKYSTVVLNTVEKEVDGEKVIVEITCSMSEKDERDKLDLKNNAIKKLEQVRMQILEEISKRENALKNNEREWRKYVVEFERYEDGPNKGELKKDKDGHVIIKNEGEQARIRKERDHIIKEMASFNEMQKKCQRYLSELRTPIKQIPVQQTPAQQTPAQQTPAQQVPVQQTLEKIYSHSKDIVNAININAAEGKAHATTIRGKSREIDIKEIIKNKKGLFKDLKINEKIQGSNIKSKIQQFMIRKKINPVILEAIKDDGDEAINDYITSVIEGRKFKFDYEHNLENSILSTKEHRFMNKIALAEGKIEGNEVKGAEKIYTIKNLFMKAKSKVKMIGKKEVLALGEGEKSKQPKENKFKQSIKDKANSKDDIIEKKMKEVEEKIKEEYGKLTEDQKKIIENYSTKNDNDIDNLQRLGIDYNIAFGIIEKYGNKTNKDKEEAKGTEQGD